MEWVFLVLIGFIAGTIGSLVGLGGGIIVVPAMLFSSAYFTIFENVTPQTAVGTSLLVVIFTGLSSTLAYMKVKKVDYKSGLIFFIGSGPGGIIGAYLNKYLNLDSFSLYFGLFMIFVSLLLMMRDKWKPKYREPGQGDVIRYYPSENGQEAAYFYKPVPAVFISFGVGFISGLFGIGGGALMVPAMVLLFLFPPHIAVATSMFIIFLSGISSSVMHIALGNVNWLFALALIPGAWAGGKAGAMIAAKLSGKAVINLLRLVLIAAGLKLIYEGIF
ncbi:sulfite exporter TauE/SafE family protein [Peribacillus frigoritolerans]|uniref:sulfite exporter TauE/SafE family protein n=1 Tax=Peribacillus frigoritolerans TaxID=450367 RepID=UPI00105A5E92|nr:sulfite exporter TauE/SafE family protein [Peribacillus frigoritolerans]TDL78688.1 sulfite exporter TauE/SafE family protein [Peribacillus frigoritolerans]